MLAQGDMQSFSPTSPIFFEATSRVETMSHQEPDTLEQLQTPQQVELLDKIDELRSQGLGHHGISLPQLVVCGDQSSGKSSVLERLTRLRFPTAQGLCTTFATEVVLRKEADVEIVCTIIPSRLRTVSEKKELAKFRESSSSRETFDIEPVMKKAMAALQHGSQGKETVIFEDVLRIRYSGPELPSLTIVDLPGLIAGGSKESNAAQVIARMVTDYTKDDKSIILAVANAYTDFNCQQLFIYLPTVDPNYSRTLGILTKTDLIDVGSDQEKIMLSAAKNETYVFGHGWHVLRNRGLTTPVASLEERDEVERNFFSNGIWSSLRAEDVGITTLRAKLSRLLLEHINKELPSLITAVQDAVANTEARLKLLGTARDTIGQQRSYLAGHAQTFYNLTNDALRGIYINPFFALSSPETAACTRLRTKVQNLNIAFTQIMHRKGHTWQLTPELWVVPALTGSCDESILDYNDKFDDPNVIDREEFLESHIGKRVRESRQYGLPSLVNPSVIGEVFREQSRNWRDIARYHLQRVFTAMTEYVEEALGSLIDSYTYSMLMLKHIRPELERRWRNAEAKLEELLIPYTEQEPITYDSLFLYRLWELRRSRCNTQEQENAKEQTDSQPTKPNAPSWINPHHPLHSSLYKNPHLLKESPDAYTNSEILDLVQSYYGTAISVFISNVAVLGIENSLIKDLSAIFLPKLIIEMEDELLRAIASESQEIRDEREALTQKLNILQSGKRVLLEHIEMRPKNRAAAKPNTAGLYIKAQPAKYSSRAARKEETQQTNEAIIADVSNRASAKLAELESEQKSAPIDDLALDFTNLAVTPPSTSPERSHQRVDSATSTPVPQKKPLSRRPSPSARPMRFDIPPAIAMDTTDDEL